MQWKICLWADSKTKSLVDADRQREWKDRIRKRGKEEKGGTVTPAPKPCERGRDFCVFVWNGGCLDKQMATNGIKLYTHNVSS